MKRIAWIGTGVMGGSMIKNLVKAGYDVQIYNRSVEKAKALESEHIHAFASIAHCVAQADVIFTMVGFPADVEEVYCAPHGILTNAKSGSIVVDMTTSSPALAKKLYALAKEKNIACLDAPVSGGDIGAQNGTLSIMAGGEEATFQAVIPMFEAMGKNIVYMGLAGCGQHTKMANQIAVAGATAAACEAIVYAKANDLDPHVMLRAISAGAAGSWQLTNQSPKILQEDFRPGFFIKHFIKDMHLAQTSIAQHDIHLEMLDAVCKMYEALQDGGYENEGTQALIRYYQNN